MKASPERLVRVHDPEPAEAPSRRPTRLRRWGRRFLIAAAGAVIVVAALGLLLRWQLRGSLPRLDGTVLNAGVEAAVKIDRDAAGVPTLEAENRRDLAFALGFLHGQERFFQMDLQRRRAAGELAELLGPVAAKADGEARVFQFRRRAREVLRRTPAETLMIVEAYSDGVNAGLKDLPADPFEYVLLLTDPRPWTPEDSVLSLHAMFLLLHGKTRVMESGMGLMKELLPVDLFAFLTPSWNRWDAPIAEGPEEIPPLLLPSAPPQSELPRAASLDLATPPSEDFVPALALGSNSWAVAGEHTAGDGALLANDMHLPLTVPTSWYRASFRWPGEAGQESYEVTGVTMPGTPLMVVGSNRRFAWGFSNAFVDTGDLVLVETDPEDPSHYRTPDGPQPFDRQTETIRVRGGADQTLEVILTRWGPLVGSDYQGRPRAYRWTALDSEAVDFGLLGLETASTLEEALDVANLSGLPPQNFVIADADGRVAWSLAGRVPDRRGDAGPFPTSWAGGEGGWTGYLGVEDLPRVVDPPLGRVWTANNQVIGGGWSARLGDGGWVPGARAQQIRDSLLSLEAATAEDMLALQLDDRSLFLDRWRQIFLDVLTPAAVAQDPRRGQVRTYLERPTGRAAVSSVDYRLVRGARSFLAVEVFDYLTAPCREADPDFHYTQVFTRHEGPLWALVTERPEHLLKPGYGSWEEQILAAMDRMVAYLGAGGESLEKQTWGRRNSVRVRHPLSMALPFLGRWLDMPIVQLPGDSYMPRVQDPTFGASQRMVVSPGREQEGIFHMPAGQSGHPLSPHYADGQAAWAEAVATPFLPGEAVHTLMILPGGDPEFQLRDQLDR